MVQVNVLGDESLKIKIKFLTIVRIPTASDTWYNKKVFIEGKGIKEEKQSKCSPPPNLHYLSAYHGQHSSSEGPSLPRMPHILYF